MFTLINISGLAVGMAGFALFWMGSAVKLNSDRFHQNGDRIYSLVQVLPSEDKDEKHTAFVPSPLIPVLQNEFPEIEDAVRVMPVGEMIVRRGDESFHENGFLFVDPNFLSFFTFEMASGDPETVLSQPFSIVLSEATAYKFFGDSNPIGKILKLDKKINVTVTGIIKTVKRTSSIRFNYLVSLETARSLYDIEDCASILTGDYFHCVCRCRQKPVKLFITFRFRLCSRECRRRSCCRTDSVSS